MSYTKSIIPLLSIMMIMGCSEGMVEDQSRYPGVSMELTESTGLNEKPVAERSKVVCDHFKLITHMTDSTLTFSVETDLPDDTVVMVSVRREYLEKFATDLYSVDYFSEKSTIGQWRKSRSIAIDNAAWIMALKTKQEKMAELGGGLEFEVGSISDHITVSMVVPINQPSRQYGANNENLDGTAVVQKNGIRIVTNEVKIDCPLNRSSLVGSQRVPSERKIDESINHIRGSQENPDEKPPSNARKTAQHGIMITPRKNPKEKPQSKLDKEIERLRSKYSD